MDHPLASYLSGTGERAYEFADRAGLGRAQVYQILRGMRPNLHLVTAAKIEAATEGQVTMRAIYDWLREQDERAAE